MHGKPDSTQLYALNEKSDSKKSGELLLQSALSPDKPALTKFKEWRASTTLEDVKAEEGRILPLLYRNLQGKTEDPILGIGKGIYRRTWYRNQILLRQVAVPVLKMLKKAGIETMLLKGAALTLSVYKDLGLRAMEDIDILVPTKDALSAIAVLEKNGWKIETSYPKERLVKEAKSTTFWKSGKQIDLHWHVLAHCLKNNDDDHFWEESQTIKFGGISTRILSPSDQLLHVLVHSATRGPTLLRWVPDSVFILNSSLDVDWKDFINQIRERHIRLQIVDALRYLKRTFSAPISARIFKRIESYPTTALERSYHLLTTGYRKPKLFKSLLWVWQRHHTALLMSYGVDAVQRMGIVRKILLFVNYLQLNLKLKYWWQVPFGIATRAFRYT